ncbi:MAG: peptide chain release factor 2 [Mogibacterium sp.]|nr:peptide chain release factor 2 [Mogibacterium sp.]
MIQLDEIRSQLPALNEKIAEVGAGFDPAGLKKRIKELEDASLKEGFWDDQKNAQKVLREKKSLEDRLGAYERLEAEIGEIPELIDIADELEDEEEAKSVARSFDRLAEELEDLRTRMLLSGKYDNNDAILSIHAGTGGVDANDWAEMLERMYLRYCEKKGFKTKILDRQDDVDYGIKSSTIQVEGDNAYGLLKSETGVHRLVRISPFNSMGKRQTSFAAVEVVPELSDDIEVNIDQSDLKIDTYRSGGAGGQHVNTTDSAVRITHLPTGIVVTCQNERSQIMNREVAMKILISKLTRLAEEAQKENLNEIKGDQSMATWGSQIRNYVFQPYTMVKDTRTGAEVGNVDAVMDGDIDVFVRAKLSQDASGAR